MYTPTVFDRLEYSEAFHISVNGLVWSTVVSIFCEKCMDTVLHLDGRDATQERDCCGCSARLNSNTCTVTVFHLDTAKMRRNELKDPGW
jgi:hypothetical protein